MTAVVADARAGRSFVCKGDDDQHVASCEIYVPTVPDTDGDFMTPDQVRKMAYAFMARGDIHKIDVGHDNEQRRAYLVESFIARDGDADFIPGVWVGALYVPDDALWAVIKDGSLNGVSIEATATRTKTAVTLAKTERLSGTTEEAAGHAHDFEVRFNADGARSPAG